MKAVLILLAAIMISSSTFAKKTTPSFTGKNQHGIVTHSGTDWTDTLPVPVNIRTAFNTKYPNATLVTWYKYNPGTMPVEPGVWYATLDPSDYYVSFVWDNSDYVAWFDNGNWIHSSKRIDNTELPETVSKVISSQYPGYIITDVDLETDKGQTVYEVDLEKGDQKWNVHISPEGSIVKKKQRSMTKADVQGEMVTDFKTRYPTASAITWYKYSPRDMVEILPSDWDYSLDPNDYEVRFTSDGAEYVAWYDNGKWVRSEVYTFDVSKLPVLVNQSISKEFAGYAIKDVDREDKVNQVLYEVELQKGNDKCKIHYAADGSIVKKKCRVDQIKTKS